MLPTIAAVLGHVCSSLLAAAAACAVVSVMLPTLISSTTAGEGKDGDSDLRAELALSRFESVLMLVCYGLFLVFQLVTHRCAKHGCGADRRCCA